jgi:hypothetical protein
VSNLILQQKRQQQQQQQQQQQLSFMAEPILQVSLYAAYFDVRQASS